VVIHIIFMFNLNVLLVIFAKKEFIVVTCNRYNNNYRPILTPFSHLSVTKM